MMHSQSILLRCCVVWALGNFLCQPGLQADSFVPGNIVLLRVGDGQGSVDGSTQPVSLVEYSTDMAEIVNEIPIPSFSFGGGGQSGLTLNGLSEYSGMMNVSADGKWLTIAGMDAQVGNPSVASTSAIQVNRIVAAISGAGEVRMVAQLTDGFSGGEIHSVVTENASTYYVIGSPNGPAGGVRHISAASGKAVSTQISPGALRHITIAKDRSGNKILIQASHSRIEYYNSFPSTAVKPTPIIFASGFTGGNGSFVFLDLDETTKATGLNGLDTLYWVSGTDIQKYEWREAGWTWRGAAVYGPIRAITARMVDDVVEILAVTNSMPDNHLIKVTDDSGFGGSWNKGADAFTQLATSGNYRFCGLAFAPVSTDLRTLSLSAGSLSPAFSGSAAGYTATVSSESISITATSYHAYDTIQVRVNGGAYRAVSSGCASELLALQVGSNTVEILVQSQDGTISSTYNVTVTRISVPTLTLPTSASLEGTTAMLGGSVTSDGGAMITEQGVIYAPAASNQEPAVHGTRVPATTGTTGIFNVSVTGLMASTTYSFRAYATNIAGTSFSPLGNFTTESYLWTDLAGMPGRFGIVDGAGNAARFSSPFGVAVTGAGDVYVADTYNQTIRKISPSGEVVTLAGSPGISGSADGKGLVARFGSPRGVAVDHTGNIYVADTNNHTIRKVSLDGMVTTLAGCPGYSGSADGMGGDARFYSPNGVAADADGNVYVADTYNQTIRKISTVAGSHRSAGFADGMGGSARFVYPLGVAIDGQGAMYVADSGNKTIRRIAPNGLVTTLAGSPGAYGNSDGPSREARFGNPRGVAVDGSGNVYVADTYNQTIRKVTPAGEVSTFAASPPDSRQIGAESKVQYPCGVAVDGRGSVYVADIHNKTIRKITRSPVTE